MLYYQYIKRENIMDNEELEFNVDEAVQNEQNEDLDFLYTMGRELAMHRLPEKYMSPGYTYRPVIITYTQPMDLLADIRVPKMIKDGWEIVYTDSPNIDLRGKAPKTKPNVRKSPFIVKRASGHKALWMRIPDELLSKRTADKAAANDQRLIEAVSMQSKKDQINIKGEELNAEHFR